MASCLPSQLGMQQLGALGFPQEAQRKGGREIESNGVMLPNSKS